MIDAKASSPGWARGVISRIVLHSPSPKGTRPKRSTMFSLRASSTIPVATASSPTEGTTPPSTPTAVTRSPSRAPHTARTVAATRQADHREALVAEVVGHHRDVVSPVTDRAVEVIGRAADTRALDADEPEPTRLGLRRGATGIWRRPPGVPWNHSSRRPSGSPNSA